MISDKTTVKPTKTDASQDEQKAFERRGLFAAAWAAVAALVLTKSSESVEAASGQQFQDSGGGGFVNNSAGGPSALFSNSLFTSTSSTFVGYAFQGAATAGLAGINGSGSAIAPLPTGCYGTVNKAISGGGSTGVLGENSNNLAIGVLGRSGVSTNNLLDGTGVQGESGGGVGVRGLIPSGNKFGMAVYGANNSSYTGGTPGAGGFGVYGYSTYGHALLGVTSSSGAASVVGVTNGVADAYAGLFYGTTVVVGSLIVYGAKSAAVAHPDGSHRLVYCMESPESWFEDFGKGQLDCGQAAVAIDPNFAAVVNMDDYHVFVTVYDQPNDLIVSERTPSGFRVEARDENSRGEFSWRIVAKRKDIVGERLAKTTRPVEPVLPDLPNSAAEAGTVAPTDNRRRNPQ